MQIHHVTSDSLAALMLMNKALEPYPEPFRLQPSITFVIPFKEYVTWVMSLPRGSHLLYAETAKIQGAIESANMAALLRYFYADMAMALGKELHFAELYGKRASNIRHSFEGVQVGKAPTVSARIREALPVILSTKRFAIPVSGKIRNTVLLEHACTYLQGTQNPTFEWYL